MPRKGNPGKIFEKIKAFLKYSSPGRKIRQGLWQCSAWRIFHPGEECSRFFKFFLFLLTGTGFIETPLYVFFFFRTLNGVSTCPPGRIPSKTGARVKTQGGPFCSFFDLHSPGEKSDLFDWPGSKVFIYGKCLCDFPWQIFPGFRLRAANFFNSAVS